ncbi:hypothetical protein BD779DRAFT_1537288, partial [Infundibulicybe gibba]
SDALDAGVPTRCRQNGPALTSSDRARAHATESRVDNPSLRQSKIILSIGPSQPLTPNTSPTSSVLSSKPQSES